LQVLARVLPQQGRVLELASGSGQHVAHFARHLPRLHFLPSDLEQSHLASIRAWTAELPNVDPPLLLDVCAQDYGVGLVDAMFCANLVHIAPWRCAEGLFQATRRHLLPGGLLIAYGPYHIDGRPTSPSNADFDADLRKRDPSWGVRDLEAIAALAESVGLSLEQRLPMPANNQLLVFRKPVALGA
jgi:SAM-dependent methyltransferase